MSSARLNIARPISWPHHNGGWRWIVELLTTHLHDPNGTRCVTAVEEELYFHGPIREPWVGFVHQIPKPFERPVQTKAWRASRSHCRGLWVLSEYLRCELRDLGVTVPIGLVRHATRTPVTYWTPEVLRAGPPEVYFIGEFQRNYQSFYDLEAGDRKKILLAPHGFDPRALGITDNGSVNVRDRVESASYERTLARSVVFLNLLDACANNTVVECLARATPLIINRLAGVEEYLGADYPLFYDTMDEAAAWLRSEERLVAGSRHLAALPMREEVTGSAFLETVQRTAFYRDLPIP
jgi:hypothetical protein